MGSYNTSCFVTKQTISSGDRCQVVPIVQASSYSSMTLKHGGQVYTEYNYANTSCYASRHWEPQTYFLEGRYEDRSEVELVDTKVNRHRLLNFMRDALRCIPVIEPSEKSSRDQGFNFAEFMAREAPELKAYLEAQSLRGQTSAPEVNRDLLFAHCQTCFKLLQEQAQCQSLFWRASNGAMRPMSFAVMHGATFDALVEMQEQCIDREGNSMRMRPFFDRALQAAKDERANAKQEYANDKDLDAGVNKNTIVEMIALEAFKNAFERTGADMSFRNVSEMTAARYGARAFFNGNLTEDMLFEALKPALESQYAAAGLERVNAHFEPMVYAGQDYRNAIGQSYARLVQQVNERVSYENDVRIYGEFQRYIVDVIDPEVLELISKQVRDADHSWKVIRLHSPRIAGGVRKAELFTSMSRKNLQAMLFDFDAGDGHRGRVNACSLQEIDENEQPVNSVRGVRP